MDATRLASYPGTGAGRLVPVLARFLGVDEDQIAVGCGSDELIDAAFRLATPGAELRHPVPTFSMVPIYASANRLCARPVTMASDGSLRAESLVPRPGGAAYLCSPNNPTGTLLPGPLIEEVVGRSPADSLVILDAAYAEFTAQPSWFDEAVRSGRLLVLRTLSKAWGLAGLRIGYAVGHASLIARINAIRGPYTVNAVAEAAAAAALEQDAGWMRARADEVVRNRGRLIERLCAMGHRPWPSQGNFVLLPVPDAAVVTARLLARGVAVRPFTGLPVVGDAVRIGIGPWPLLEQCLAALTEALP